MDDASPSTLTITYTHGAALADWTFDGVKDGKKLNIKKGQKIQIEVLTHGGKVQECVVLSGPIADCPPGATSPFVKGTPRVFGDQPFVLEVQADKGRWGMSIAFTVFANGIASFYFVPDPELQVGS